MIADVLETIVEGIKQTAKVNTVVVVDPRLPMVEVRTDLPFVTIQPMLGRRAGSLIPVPTAIETVDNPDYPKKSKFRYLCRMIYADDQHLPLLVQAVADPEVAFGEDESADTVADRAWAYFRGVGREDLKAHHVRVLNLDVPAMVGTVDLGIGTEESALARASFTVELVIPTVVYVDVPTIERVVVRPGIPGVPEVPGGSEPPPSGYICPTADTPGALTQEDLRRYIEDQLLGPVPESDVEVVVTDGLGHEPGGDA